MRRVSSHLATWPPVTEPVESGPTIDLDPDIGLWEPGLTTIDLNKFEGLTASDQRRVIIRVLCGLVALGETTAEPAVSAVEPEARSLPQTPRPRLAPLFLDGAPETVDLDRLPPPPPQTSVAPERRRLPFLGIRRPF